MPPSLISILEVTDGFDHAAGQWSCSWPVSQIAEENRRRWAAGLLPRGLIAFGDNGAGDPFCLVMEGPAAGHVMEWSAMARAAVRTWPSLERFWPAWLNG